MEGMIPQGAESWQGQLSQDLSVTLDSEGVYVYQCDPHLMMAMIGVIQVGNAVNLDEVKKAAVNQRSRFIMNSDRLDNYLSQL
jgi:pseudoazurin